MSGDLRITPFYPMPEVRAKIESYVKEINEKIADFADAKQRGPFSKVIGVRLCDIDVLLTVDV